MCKKLICLIFFVLVSGIVQGEPLVWDRAAYWDSRYPTGWADAASAANVRDALVTAGYPILDADQLKIWMDGHIADGKLSVVVFCRDIVPDTVAETNTAACTLRKYLDAGGKIVFYADIPFYYQGHADNTNTNWAMGGSTGILGFSAASATWDRNNIVQFTAAGTNWGLTATWSSVRPTSPTVTTNLTVLATDGSGDAAAWVKHYVPGDRYRGFVRTRDVGGMPNVNDLIRLAEYAATKAENPIPANGSHVAPLVSGSNIYMVLDYTAGNAATTHTAYFSDVKADVESRDAGHRLGSPPWPDVDPEAYYVGYDDPLIPAFARTPLVPGKTYYWCVDEYDGTKTWPGNVWSFAVMPEETWGPTPPDGDTLVVMDPNVLLSWRLGNVPTGYTVKYPLYYSTSKTAVDTGTTPNVVVSTTSKSVAGLQFNTTYYWRVDTRLNNMTPPFLLFKTIKGKTWSFTTGPRGIGSILMKYYDGIPGVIPANLYNNANYPDNPTSTSLMANYEMLPSDWDDQYGVELEGWIYVKQSGNYTFWIASDDGSELWLSTDDEPANEVMIASVSGWTSSRNYDGTAGVPGANQESAPIALTGGMRYYTRAVMKEDGGGDNIAVTWSGPDSGDVRAPVLPGSHLKAFEQNWPHSPNPADGSADVALNAKLSWKAGIDSGTGGLHATQRVYFGTNAAAVAAAGTTSPEYKGGPSEPNGYGPLSLSYYQRYYWRIEGVEAGGKVRTSPVWAFKAIYNAALVTDPNLRVWLKFDDDATDSSGHGRDGTEMGGPTYAAGYVDQAINLDGVDDWVVIEDPVGITGAGPRTIAGWAKASWTGIPAWTNVFGFTGPSGTGGHSDIEAVGDTATTTWGYYGLHVYGWERNIIPIDLEWHHLAATYDGTTASWYGDGVLIASEAAPPALNTPDNVHVGKRFDNANYFPGLVDDVRIYDRALTGVQIATVMRINLALAWSPRPMHGATGVSRTPILTWKPGNYAPPANGHYVNFGADDPANMVLVSGPQTPNNYTPTVLDLDRSYYWVIDEVNAAAPGGVNKGRIWKFTTSNNLVVDDMEKYVPGVTDPNIYKIWVDGAGDCVSIPGNNSGALVDISTLAALGPVHGDQQAMKFVYDNDGTVNNPCTGGTATRLTYSKAEALVVKLPSGIGSNWIVGGVKALSLWFYGDPLNLIEPMWVRLTDASNNTAKVLYGKYADEDVKDVNEASWHEWLIDLTVPGVNVSNVKSIAIGVGNETGAAGSSGTLYFDDIRLYTPRCILTRRPADYAKFDYAPEGTPGGDCVINGLELEIMTRDWLQYDYNVNPVAPNPAGLKVWYNFDGNANDSSGNINNGTENGGLIYAEGRFGPTGQAVSLDGVDDYVSTTKTASQLGIGGNGPKTVSVWVYTQAFNNGGIWDIGNRATAEDFCLRTLSDATHPAAEEWWRIQYWGGDYDFRYPSLNKWVHFGHVHDGTRTKIYADGKLIVDWAITLNTTDTSPFEVGRYGWPDSYFNGLIDDFKLYNYALSHGEILFAANMGTLYVPVASPANVSDLEPALQKKVNFKDYAVLLSRWLDETEWPLP